MKLRQRTRGWRQANRIKKVLIDGFDGSIKRADVGLPRPKLHFSRTSRYPLDAILTRSASGQLAIDFTGPEPGMLIHNVPHKLAPYLYWLVNCPPEVRSITVSMSDGEYPTGAMFSPSSADPTQHLLPDPFFFAFRGFEEYRNRSERHDVPWSKRSTVIRWRGMSFGQGRIDFSDSSAFDPGVLQRMRFLMLARKIDGFDAGFVAAHEPWMEGLFDLHGFKSSRIPETDWINDRFAIDIDGYTNTWSNMIARMHFGCCVLKIGSQFGFRQWYYDDLTPWEHYVPVRSDMSDLAEKVAWVRGNPRGSEEIARNGQAFVRTMTFASETRRAAEIITRALRSADC